MNNVKVVHGFFYLYKRVIKNKNKDKKNTIEFSLDLDFDVEFYKIDREKDKVDGTINQ